jgi:hypothetical protein
VRTPPAASAPTALVGSIARRFPLVARPKPRALALGARIAKVRDLAAEAAHGTDASLTRAAEALNLAALIASDCGMPDLARILCWRQFKIFRGAGPFDAETTKLALQPAINLARLLVREGNGMAAHEAVMALFGAVKAKSHATIEGEQIAFDQLISTETDHRQVVEWLWTVVLSDGTRALTAAGKWAEALQHVEKYRGVGQRLFDGRQVMIVERCLSGEPAAAQKLVTQSTITEPWEKALATSLTAFCLRAEGRQIPEPAEMMQAYLHLGPTPSLVRFRTQLALAIHDLVPRNIRDSIIVYMVRDILAARDGLAGQAVLDEDQISVVLAQADHAALNRLVRSAGLNHTTFPPALLTDLNAAAQQAAAVAALHLRSP